MMTDATQIQTPDTAALFRKRTKKRLLLLAAGFFILLFSVLLDVSWGPSDLTVWDVIRTIFHPYTEAEVGAATGGMSLAQVNVIVWDVRLPVAFMAVLVGAMLGVAGAEMQTILNNPLADPFTLGISSAAAFGASMAIVFQWQLVPDFNFFNLWNFHTGSILVTMNAFIMALVASVILYAFTKVRGVTAETMVLVGIAMMFTFNALLAMMQYGASETQLSQIVFWMMGSLSRATPNKILVCVIMLAIIVPYFVRRNWALTALRMGDDKAASLGVNVKRLRIEMLIGVSLLAATAVSFVGTVAFVGLVGPHIARMIVGEDQRYFLPLSAMASGLIMSATSIISKSITPGVIYPIGIITSLIGIPFFLSLILAVRRRSW